VILFSCENPIKTVQDLASEDTVAGVVANDITFYRSDSGHVQVELKAPKMLRQESDSGKLEFSEGFVAKMFDNSHRTSSQISADYGVSDGTTDVIEARGNVLVENFNTHEVMQSDELFWYQKQKMIYTRSNVKITTPDKIIYGDSLSAKEDFSEYSVFHVTATLDIEDK